jgi:hypothetical protein
VKADWKSPHPFPPGIRIHFIMEMIWWASLAPGEFEFLFSGSLTSTFLALVHPTIPSEEGTSQGNLVHKE